MERKQERIGLKIAAAWNVLIGLVTMFGYYPWFEETGIAAFEAADSYNYTNSSLVGMMSKVVLVIALATILIGLISWRIGKYMKDGQIEKKTMYWLVACLVLMFISYDVIGILLYLVTTIFYVSKNKGIRLAKNKVGGNYL